MTTPPYSPLNALVQRVAASALGARFFARTLHHLDRWVLRLSGGRHTLTSLLAGVPVVMVTTTGARSGLPRTVPLLAVPDDQDPRRFALVASNWGQRRLPAWYFNLKATPQATCARRGEARLYAAREAEGDEYQRFWRLATAHYRGFPLYRQRAGGRPIPILVMTPLDEDSVK